MYQTVKNKGKMTTSDPSIPTLFPGDRHAEVARLMIPYFKAALILMFSCEARENSLEIDSYSPKWWRVEKETLERIVGFAESKQRFTVVQVNQIRHFSWMCALPHFIWQEVQERLGHKG